MSHHNIKHPLISVVIPTYNRSRGLIRTLESVISQTIDEIEIVIVDDGSTDDTLQFIKSIDDPRIHLLNLSRNSGGPAIPMSIGVNHSKAPIIAFLDHDDVAWPQWLEVLYGVVKSDPRIGMTWGTMRIVDDMRRVISVAYRNPFRHGRAETLLPTMLTWTPGTSSLLVRREVFDAIGNFDERMGPVADLDFTFRFAYSGRWSIRISSVCVADHHVHTRNLSSQLTDSYLTSMLNFVDKHSDCLSKIPSVKAEYLYRASRLSFSRKENRCGWHYLVMAVRTFPFHGRALAFAFFKILFLERAWCAISVFLAERAARRRKREAERLVG